MKKTKKKKIPVPYPYPRYPYPLPETGTGLKQVGYIFLKTDPFYPTTRPTRTRPTLLPVPGIPEVPVPYPRAHHYWQISLASKKRHLLQIQ